jgi:hypothetical protein
LLFFFSCKRKNNTEKDLPRKEELQNYRKLNMSDILKIENDSLLLLAFIAFKNNELVEENGDLEQQFYDGHITYASDSEFKVLNLLGEYSGGATYNPYAKNFILRNQIHIHSAISGNIFRIETKSNGKEYTVWSDNISRMGSDITRYKAYFSKDSLIITDQCLIQ